MEREPEAGATNPALIVLPPARMLLCEQVRHQFAIDVAIGVSLNDVMRPHFWTHHSTRLAPWDRIEVRAEDGSWFAELLVLATDRTWTRVHLLSRHSLTSADVSLTQASDDEVAAFRAALEVMHRGPRKWSVVRKEGREVLSEDKQAKSDAEAAADEIARAEAAHAHIEAID